MCSICTPVRALLKFDGDFPPDLGTEDSPADIVSEKYFLISDCHKSRLKRFGAWRRIF